MLLSGGPPWPNGHARSGEDLTHRPNRIPGRGAGVVRRFALVAKLHADKAYEIPRHRRALAGGPFEVGIARTGKDCREMLVHHSQRTVERTLARLTGDRPLTVRSERCDDTHAAFLALRRTHLLKRPPAFPTGCERRS
jgi:hypothetical protein